MALFGRDRDISLFRHMSRELMADIITQQIGYYKYDLGKTVTNMYGEAADGRYYIGPVLLNCLIELTDQTFTPTDFGPDFSRTLKFRFLRDDLVESNVVPELGDIIMYNEGYYEVEQSVENQFFVGKDPDYSYSEGLNRFGSSISIIVSTHYVPADQVNITNER
jgi:hypothetical protein